MSAQVAAFLTFSGRRGFRAEPPWMARMATIRVISLGVAAIDGERRFFWPLRDTRFLAAADFLRAGVATGSSGERSNSFSSCTLPPPDLRAPRTKGDVVQRPELVRAGRGGLLRGALMGVATSSNRKSSVPATEPRLLRLLRRPATEVIADQFTADPKLPPSSSADRTSSIKDMIGLALDFLLFLPATKHQRSAAETNATVKYLFRQRATLPPPLLPPASAAGWSLDAAASPGAAGGRSARD